MSDKLTTQEMLQKQLRIIFVHASRSGDLIESEVVRMIQAVSDDGCLPEGVEFHDAPVNFDELLKLGAEIDAVKNGLIELSAYLRSDDVEAKEPSRIITLN